MGSDVDVRSILPSYRSSRRTARDTMHLYFPRVSSDTSVLPRAGVPLTIRGDSETKCDAMGVPGMSAPCVPFRSELCTHLGLRQPKRV